MRSNTLYGYHTQQDTAITRFVERHPMLSSTALFALLPIGLLTAVGGAATIILLPLAMVLGWV